MLRSYTGALASLVLIPLFVAAPPWELLRGTSLTSIINGDFWWHLRTGIAILQRHSFPHDGWFSQSAAMPWMASSWLYDVAVALGYSVFDLRFVPLLAVTCKLALAIVTFVLAGELSGRFWTAVGFSAIVQVLLFKLQPIPVYCSVLAFALELILLLKFRSTGSGRPLYFLPLLFLFWANLDPYFVYGIVALLLFALTCAVEQGARREGIRWLPPHQGSPPRLAVVGVPTIASVLATCLTPYGWGAYSSFCAFATGTANQRLPDFQSLRFRSPQDYLLLLLVMSAFLALGLRRSRDPFQIGLLVLCTIAAFHAQRDLWLVAIASVAIIANAVSAVEGVARQESSAMPYARLLVPAGVSLVVLFAIFAVRVPDRQALLAKIGEAYPVGAADYIREQQLPAPLFNTFPWGGFLTWYLPEYPVAIDSRIDLYGPELNAQYVKAMNFEAHYSTFAPLNQAGTILLEKNSTMAKALATVPAFRTVYSDNVAVVLVREQVGP